MSDGIGAKVEGLFDGLEDINKPAIAQLRAKLKKYLDTEKAILAAVGKMSTQASGLEVQALNLIEWGKKNKGPDADAVKKRTKDLARAADELSAFADAINGVIEGTPSAKTKLPGGTFDKVLRLLVNEMSDKVIGPVKKIALAYYPVESAGQKKLQEWAVHLNQLAAALNEGLAELDPNDQVEDLNLKFGKQEVLAAVVELKRKIDGLGI
jgi:ElaB/YqjD/DUF883 family membrane-anchored ribosome-binding protein